MTITAKLGNMRKEVEWTVYPASANTDRIIIQSDSRIASLDPKTCKGMLSKACPGGAYFPHLISVMGATEIDVPPNVIAEAMAEQPKSGDEIGPGVFVA